MTWLAVSLSHLKGEDCVDDEGTQKAKRDRRTSRLAVNMNKFSADKTREQIRIGFKKQTRGFYVAAHVLLAGRSALRVLPFHVSLLSKAEDGAPLGFQEILRRLRCHITATIASLSARNDLILFLHAAVSARINLPDEHSDSAELACSHAISAAALENEQRAKTQASYALAYSVWDHEGSKYARSAIEKDINALGSSGEIKDRNFLVARPLWPSVQLGAGEIQAKMELDENRTNIPQSIDDSWLSLKEYLINAGNDWDVWVDWYEDILRGETDGQFLFNLSTEKSLKLWRNVALIDDAIWKAGPAKLNAQFKRLVENARKDIIPRNQREAQGKISKKRSDYEASKTTAPKVQSDLGRIIIQNSSFLIFQSIILVRLIRQDIERIKSNPANDPDTIDLQAKEIAVLEQCLVSVEQTKEAIEAFESGAVAESKLLVKLKRFGGSLLSWFEGHAPKHIEQATQLGMVASSTAIISLTGANPTYGLLVSGVIVAKDPVIEMLKAWGDKLKAK